MLRFQRRCLGHKLQAEAIDASRQWRRYMTLEGLVGISDNPIISLPAR
ncbi:MAG: hypothetical protein ABF420_07115 [Acetobacter syzygii]